MNSSLFTIHTASIILNADKVLLVRRSENLKYYPGSWSLPCGKVDSNESIEDAVNRELLEETGLKADYMEIFSVSEFQKDNNKTRRDLQLNYFVKVSSFEVTLNPKESSNYSWVSIRNLEDWSLDPFNYRILQEFADDYCRK